MKSAILKVSDEVFALLDDLTEDPMQAQAVLQVVGTLVQEKWTQQQMKVQQAQAIYAGTKGGGIIG